MSFSRTAVPVSERVPSVAPAQGGVFRTWALDVSDDGAGCVVHELDADLGNATTRACDCQNDLLYHVERCGEACIPVRPRTRVTLTSLFSISMLVCMARGGRRT